MKAIMYHYVREVDVRLPNFVYLDVSNFKKQIDWFSKRYRFVSEKEFYDSLALRKPVENGLILTFDDGLSDHYEYVFPVLRNLGIWGIFYIPTLPLVERCLLSVHKVHYLLGRYSGEAILKALRSRLTASDFVLGGEERFRGSVYLKQSASDAVREVKTIVNYYLKPELKNKILSDLMADFSENEVKVAGEYYMSKAQIVELQKCGFTIGSHAHTHNLLANLNDDEQSAECRQSLEILERLVGEVKTFCFPYGGVNSYNSTTLQILQRSGIVFSFSVESRDIAPEDLTSGRLLLPRYDCNEFEYGRASGII